jgi:stage III sporulation protein AG
MAMEGVGNVKVMITLKESASDLFSEETEEGEVLGVVVVAEGAGRAEVDAKIMTSVEALFGIEAHKISIVKMRSQEVGK